MEKAALIADDDEFFRIALRAILKNKLGFAEVIESCSLDEAIEQLSARNDVSLALFDLAMPGMETAASLRAVRECFPELRTAVVSASERRRDVLLALDAGVHGYVPKGLGAAQLSEALQVIEDGTIFIPTFVADLRSALEPDQEVSVPQQASMERLTPRQREVLQLLVQGKSNKEIARQLDLGLGTVKVHMAALFRALGVTSRSAAAAAGSRLLSR